MEKIIELLLNNSIENNFINLEIFKTVILILLWFLITIMVIAGISYINNNLQKLYKQNSEKSKNITMYIIGLLLCIMFLIYAICNDFKNIYYLFELCINPKYIYLNHLINLIK